jgi:hypothetical protein
MTSVHSCLEETKKVINSLLQGVTPHETSEPVSPLPMIGKTRYRFDSRSGSHSSGFFPPTSDNEATQHEESSRTERILAERVARISAVDPEWLLQVLSRSLIFAVTNTEPNCVRRPRTWVNCQQWTICLSLEVDILTLLMEFPHRSCLSRVVQSCCTFSKASHLYRTMVDAPQPVDLKW